MQYHQYEFTKKEMIQNMLVCLSIIWGISYCFYHSIIACIILSPLSILLLKARRKDCAKKRLKLLNNHFKDGISFVSGALNAGYSLENAFKEATNELIDLYGEDVDISKEFLSISRKLDMNISLQSLMEDFGKRSGIEDIKCFSENLSVAKRTGGDLAKIIGTTSKTISEKQQVLRDIETMVAAKRMEQNIMSIVPLLIILFVNISSPGFLDVMYQSLFGRVVMTICLVAYFGAFRLSRKLLNIEV